MLRVGISAALLACAAAALNFMPASSPLVRWVGRTYVPAANGSVFFDWEGVTATIAVTGYSQVLVSINDACGGTSVGGGSRWAVYWTPGNGKAAAPNHRIQTFYSGALVSMYYLFTDPTEACDPNCDLSGTSVFNLVRLTESRLSGCGPTGNLSITGFYTDGTFVQPPAAPTRRIEAIGDSITAGDLNSGDGQTVCGNSPWNNDITVSSAGILCSAAAGFGADCMYTAWGGISLGLHGWGMKDLYPFVFSSGGQDAYTPYDFSFQPDAVIINLGTNDHVPAPGWDWISAYVSFATQIVTQYYKNPNVTLFLAYGPMTAGYQPFVTNASAQLVAAGIHAYTLDLTLPTPMTGCYGHPSAADNEQLAAKAKPYIAQIMGW